MHRRRALTFLLGGISAAALTRVARAQTPFTTFAFPATGATSSRTDPNRWADWVNVKDYGAKGDNSTDDTAAINAAIAAAAAKGSNFTPGATVYFPPGGYQVSGALFCNVSAANVCLVGSGKHSTIISGSFAGYVIDQNDGSFSGPTRLGIINLISDMTVQNSHIPASAGIDPTIGAIRFNGSGAGVIARCFISGWTGLCATSNTFVVYLEALEFSGVGGTQYGSVGAIIGQCAIKAMTVLGYTTGVLAGGGAGGSIQGPYISGLRLEDNVFGMVLGAATDGTNVPAVGFHIDGIQAERNNTTLVIQDASYGRLSGVWMSGTVGVAQAVTSISGNGTTVTVNVPTSLANFGWTSGTRHITISDPGGAYDLAGAYVVATFVSNTQFTYSAATTGASGGSTTYSPKQTYGMRIGNCQEVVFSGVENNIAPSNLETGGAGFDAYFGANAIQVNVTMESCLGGSWNITNSNQKAAFTYINCDNPTGSTTDARSAQAGMNFADLPGQSTVSQPGPTEDQTYDIVDCNTSTFLATAAGGGSGASAHRRVRYNAAASVWQVVG